MRPTLTILIPAMNRASYVGSTIESCLAIESAEVEIIVSDNQSSDETYDVIQRYNDSRLTVVQPEEKLAMHEHWEFLLSKATGEWVTVVGDDDGVLPNIVGEVERLQRKYPFIEAICTERASFVWPRVTGSKKGSIVYLRYAAKDYICDAKEALRRVIDCKDSYHALPMLYSGGIQRRSLITRAKSMNGGQYFYHTTPDACSAINAVVYSNSFVRSFIPVCWTGTSPSFDGGKAQESVSKSRSNDFWGLLDDEDEIGSILRDYRLRDLFLSFHFYDALVRMSPSMHLRFNDNRYLKKLANAAYEFFLERDKKDQAIRTFDELNLGRPSNRIVILAKIRTAVRSSKCFKRYISSIMNRIDRRGMKYWMTDEGPSTVAEASVIAMQDVLISARPF